MFECVFGRGYRRAFVRSVCCVAVIGGTTAAWSSAGDPGAIDLGRSGGAVRLDLQQRLASAERARRALEEQLADLQSAVAASADTSMTDRFNEMAARLNELGERVVGLDADVHEAVQLVEECQAHYDSQRQRDLADLRDRVDRLIEEIAAAKLPQVGKDALDEQIRRCREELAAEIARVPDKLHDVVKDALDPQLDSLWDEFSVQKDDAVAELQEQLSAAVATLRTQSEESIAALKQSVTTANDDARRQANDLLAKLHSADKAKSDELTKTCLRAEEQMKIAARKYSEFTTAVEQSRLELTRYSSAAKTNADRVQQQLNDAMILLESSQHQAAAMQRARQEELAKKDEEIARLKADLHKEAARSRTLELQVQQVLHAVTELQERLSLSDARMDTQQNEIAGLKARIDGPPSAASSAVAYGSPGGVSSSSLERLRLDLAAMKGSSSRK